MERSQSRDEEKAMERSQSRDEEKAMERSQSREEEKAMERSQSREEEKAMERSQSRDEEEQDSGYKVGWMSYHFSRLRCCMVHSLWWFVAGLGICSFAHSHFAILLKTAHFKEQPCVNCSHHSLTKTL